MAGDCGDTVGGLVVLLDRALAGELDRADGDRGAVGVELLQPRPSEVATTPASLYFTRL
jgi:hypothetical protein